ncbi:MAG: polyprenyl synthetase family protein [Tannerella sp.]|jgi:geranylgeranyl diphosphate synthase type II|nr:polyprenyl synthetase family protein [Tannerella sp.]
MLSFEQVLKRLEPEFNKISFDQSPRCLFEPIEYILALGGKRIRPCLTLMACSIYKEDVEEAIKPAMGLEVFHNFTLLHDDLMDQADKRRNQPTVHKKWNTNTAILSGDAMLIAAYRFMGETAEPYLKNVLDLFSKTALDICCGQQYDMDFEKRDNVSEDEYIEMIRLKTAILIACCIKTGAIIGGASEKDAEHLYRFGIYIGLAFQLQDDLLDVYGDTKTFGKNIGGDILCDKKTFLLINAMILANDEQKAQLAYFRNPANNYKPEEKISIYTNIYDQLHIKDITKQKMNSLYELAIHELTDLNVAPDSLTELKKMGNMLIQRES